LEVAARAFTVMAFKRTGISPQPATPRRSCSPMFWQGPDVWWHVRAEDGANSSEFSKGKSFFWVTPGWCWARQSEEPKRPNQH